MFLYTMILIAQLIFNIIYSASYLYIIDEISLFTQRFPYTEQTKGVFDPSLGPHQGYILVDRYIFVQVSFVTVYHR